MRVIDLLNKIANGEEVPEYINYTHRVSGRDTMFVCKENIINKLDIGAIELNDEVEIIEEDKKIEKIDIEPLNERDDLQRQIEVVHYENIMIANAVNEIIDKINKGDKE